MSETAENRGTLGTRKLSLLHRMKQIAMICFVVLFSVFSINANATDPDISVNDTGTGMCVYDVLDTYSGTAGLKARWEPNEIDLYWYSDDTQITNVQSSANSCDYAGGLTVPSTPPTKTGYTFNGWTVRGLPDGYTRLEYIQSTGTQRIDTGIVPTQKTAVETAFINNSPESTTRVVIGDFYSTGSIKFLISIVALTNSFLVFGDQNKTQNSFYNTGTLFRMYMNSSGTVINGTTYNWSSTPSSFTSTGQLRMFGVTDVSGRNAIVTMYYLTIWDDGVLKRNFIPAKNSSNVVGMYDTVSKTFFTNAGTGTFTAGPVVN